MVSVLDVSRVPVPFEAFLNDFPPRASPTNPLPLVNVLQEQCNWCWAAVASNINNLLSPADQRSQCRVAGDTLVRAGCCGPDPNPCDEIRTLSPALKTVGHFAAVADPDPDDAMDQVDDELPPGAQINWSGGGSHFVAIFGYVEETAAGPARLNVADPKYGAGLVDTEVFQVSYRSAGTWATTLNTK